MAGQQQESLMLGRTSVRDKAVPCGLGERAAGEADLDSYLALAPLAVGSWANGGDVFLESQSCHLENGSSTNRCSTHRNVRG